MRFLYSIWRYRWRWWWRGSRIIAGFHLSFKPWPVSTWFLAELLHSSLLSHVYPTLECARTKSLEQHKCQRVHVIRLFKRSEQFLNFIINKQFFLYLIDFAPHCFCTLWNQILSC